MARVFDRNMFIMLLAIMIGVVIITYFVADIMRRSQIENLIVEHEVEIQEITGRNENFTDHFLQGSIKMDSAREIREVGNYHFDLAILWYDSALSAVNNSTLDMYRGRIVSNCTEAMSSYMESHKRFDESKFFFERAKNYTDNNKYLELLGYYVGFAQSGRNITLLRYNASKYLMFIAENLTLSVFGNESDNENLTLLLDLFNETMDLYDGMINDYNWYSDYIDEYVFFDEIREPH